MTLPEECVYPKEPEQVFWKIAGTATPQSVTIIKYHDQIQDETGFAINNIGIGLDASIVYAANHSAAEIKLKQVQFRFICLLVCSSECLIPAKGFPILVETNGKQLNFTKAFLCTTTNHPYFGGGVAIAPTANPQRR